MIHKLQLPLQQHVKTVRQTLVLIGTFGKSKTLIVAADAVAVVGLLKMKYHVCHDAIEQMILDESNLHLFGLHLL